MNLKPSLAQIEQMKRDAKRAKASENISHSTALDMQANMVGYSSWALLMKTHDSSGAPTTPLFRFSRSTEEMRQALQPRAGYGREGGSAEDIVGKLVSMPHAVRYAIDFMNCVLQATDVTVDKSSLAFQEMRTWLPYVTEVVGPGKYLLVNRAYDPVGKLASGHSDYGAYSYMHGELSDAQLEALAFRPGKKGTAFNDGTQPWASPTLARAYTARLERFYATLR